MEKSEVPSCEVCGTGLCGEAQPDGVPCTGTSVLCAECAKGIAAERRRQAETANTPKKDEDCLDRAGL